jgi:hypothetical protein
MRVLKIKLYKIEEHPNKEKCFEWIRDNWHDLNSHSVQEMVESLSALRDKIGGQLDFRISAVPDRGEYIRFTDYDRRILNRLDADECPLTGVCWDADVILALRAGNPSQALKALHADTEYKYSDEGLLEFCSANEYEFDEHGKVY